MRKKFLPCAVKQIEDHETMVAAAKTAVALNPTNAPTERQLILALEAAGVEEPKRAASRIVDSPQAIAMLTSKDWGSDGVDLGVSFMEATDSPLRDKILAYMNKWNKWANVRFRWSQSGGEVRISRGKGGYYSYLGPDILHIPANQQTMNLEGFVLKTPDSEYDRVVTHETGHTLGCPHEHMRQDIIGRLDRAKTVAYFKKYQGWDEAMTVSQVLTPIDEKSITGTPADVESIMTYQLPGSITIDGRPIPGGVVISDRDGQFMGTKYPLTVKPITPTKKIILICTSDPGSVSATVE